MLLRDTDSIPTYHATGIHRSIIANRISYLFDWSGPSMTIDTACSSSLVALHQAVQALRSGKRPHQPPKVSPSELLNPSQARQTWP